MALKIGLVGAGSMAQYHIAGYRRAGAEIAAVADRCGERGRALAQELGAAYFPDLASMLPPEGLRRSRFWRRTGFMLR